jgi:hypothetical protein
MTRDVYLAALAGLLAIPPRHPMIGGVQITSVEELDALAARHRAETVQTSGPIAELPFPGDSGHVPAIASQDLDAIASRILDHFDRRFGELRTAIAAVATPPQKATNVSPPSTGKHAPSADKPEAPSVTPVAPVVPAESTPVAPVANPQAPPPAAPAPAAVPGAKPVIPENLGTLTYNQLRALAKDLGISPVPNAQAELLDRIGQAREDAD